MIKFFKIFVQSGLISKSFSAQSSKLSREERLVLCIGDIINELIVAQEEDRDVQLNKLKTRLSAKYGLETSPRLVDIIAAVPHDHKKTLLPKLKAKPVRTASGVSSSVTIWFVMNNAIIPFTDSCCGSDV